MSVSEAALIESIEAIPGFLFPIACAGTMTLLRHQTGLKWRGGLLEIGIFQGKYFAVLARSAQDAGERVLGIDNFMYAPAETVWAALAAHPATRDAAATIWSGCSSTFTAAAIKRELRDAVRFASIDGSHTAYDVGGDLVLAEAVLAPHGILAIDDFLNPRALGVGEAAHAFFRDRRHLQPFALFGNKLFVAHATFARRYRDVVEGFFQRTPLPEGEAYRNLAALGADQVEQDLWGTRLVVM